MKEKQKEETKTEETFLVFWKKRNERTGDKKLGEELKNRSIKNRGKEKNNVVINF